MHAFVIRSKVTLNIVWRQKTEKYQHIAYSIAENTTQNRQPTASREDKGLQGSNAEENFDVGGKFTYIYGIFLLFSAGQNNQFDWPPKDTILYSTRITYY